MFKNRKQDRDAEFFYWKCKEKYFRHRKHQIQFSYQLPQEPQPSPSPSEIKATNFMAHIKEKART
jgi:DNA topoisomerase IB